MFGNIASLDSTDSLSTHDVIKNHRIQKGDKNPLATACTGVAGLITLALFIIGCVGAAGHLSPTVMGGCAVGLGVPLLLSAVLKAIAGKDLMTRISEIVGAILTIVVITMGALAIAGVVPATTVGWAVILPTIVSAALLCAGMCCIAGGSYCLLAITGESRYSGV